MRTAFALGRFCFRHGFQRTRPSSLRAIHVQFGTARNAPKHWLRRPPIAGPILLSALTPAAFVQLNEQDADDGKTGEAHMLEASREELKKTIPDNVHGFRRFWRGLILVFDQYIYEPLATGFRFFHLVFIFVPVIITVPAIWIGSRQKDRDAERSGTLWWYGFLVRSMERAGPAFIKVYIALLASKIPNNSSRTAIGSLQANPETCSLANGQPHAPTSFLQKCAV